MTINLSGHTRYIADIDGVIKALVMEKGLSLLDAFKEYEEGYSQIPYNIKCNIIYEHDHLWKIKEEGNARI